MQSDRFAFFLSHIHLRPEASGKAKARIAAGGQRKRGAKRSARSEGVVSNVGDWLPSDNRDFSSILPPAFSSDIMLRLVISSRSVQDTA